MTTLGPDVLDLLMGHRSIRKFTDEPIDDDTVEGIIAAGMAAATSSNLQGTTVIRVRNPETRSAIATLAGGQTYVETAAAFARMKISSESAGGTRHSRAKSVSDGSDSSPAT